RPAAGSDSAWMFPFSSVWQDGSVAATGQPVPIVRGYNGLDVNDCYLPLIPEPPMKAPLSLFLMLALSIAAGRALADDEPELIDTMGQLQLLLHKLRLSVDAGNIELAACYAHALEEAIEAAESIEAYRDIPVGRLTGSI